MRGSGRTTRQMQSAAPNSFFIFTGSRAYSEQLKQRLGRADLKLIDTHQLLETPWRGTGRPVMIDHAATLSASTLERLLEHNSRCEDQPARIDIVKVQVAAYSRTRVLIYREDRTGYFEGDNHDLAKLVGSTRKKFFYAMIVDAEWRILGEAPWQTW